MIHFVVALPAEARPLMSHYRLRRRTGDLMFPVYEAEQVRLIVSRPGKLSVAAAVGYLCALDAPGGAAAWLNVGVAGHREHILGAGFLAHSIEDQETGRRWYPPLVVPRIHSSGALITVSRPEGRYTRDGLYDMEGAGFYAAATRCASGELVQCYKVVSDNLVSPAHRVNAQAVEALITDHVPSIVELAQALDALAGELASIEGESPQLSGFLEHWRFSTSERHRLDRCLRRHAALVPGQPPGWEDFRFCRRGPEVLRALETVLAGLMHVGGRRSR